MARTVVPFGDPKAVKKWSASLFIDTCKKSYFERKFISESDNAVIQRLTDLDSGPGDTISFDLSVQLRGNPTYGDNIAEGTEEDLKFFTDQLYIDQMRKPVSAGGKMTQKRTAHNLRTVAKDRLSDYWAKFTDEMMFVYLSGARGMNEDYFTPLNWAGHAGNPIQAPDDDHIMYSGNAVSKATLTADDTMSRETIEKAAVKARMMRSTDPENATVLPVKINSEDHYVCVMTPFDEHYLRTSDEKGWLDIQKAAAAAEGRNNPLFKGGLGMINNVVLHSHESAIRFNDYGAGNSLDASRSLFMGRQAGVIAYGSEGGSRFSWKEEKKDYGNLNNVIAGTIIGVKKTRFNNKDFGVISIDSYAKDPNKA